MQSEAYAIGSLQILNGDGQPLENIPENDFHVNAEILMSEGAADAFVILAAYDQNGKMLHVYCTETDTESESGVSDIRVENADGTVEEIRAFLVPSLEMPTPLCPSVSIGPTV